MDELPSTLVDLNFLIQLDMIVDSTDFKSFWIAVLVFKMITLTKRHTLSFTKEVVFNSITNIIITLLFNKNRIFV